jgi:hypothetical protein
MRRRSYYLGIDRATPVENTEESFDMYQWDQTVMDEPHPPARVEQYPPRWSLDIQRRERWRERMYRPFRTDKSRTPAFIKRRRETNPRVEIGMQAGIIRLILAGYFDIDPEKIHTLYHSTPSTNVESIMSRGLVPGPPHKGEDPAKPWLKNVVWMADSPEAAKHHGLRQMEKKDVAGGLTVLEIQFDPKKINLYKALAPGFFTTDEAIPPEWIRVVETVKRAETGADMHPLLAENLRRAREAVGRLAERYRKGSS